MPINPSPSINTSKLAESAEGLLISISNAMAFLKVVIISIFFYEGGLSVFRSAVHQIYSPVYVSVNVILPVYDPLNSGVIINEYTTFFPGLIVKVGGPDAPTRSVSTSYVMLLSVDGFLKTRSCFVELLA